MSSRGTTGADATVRGRAVVVPATTANDGTGDGALGLSGAGGTTHANNLGPDATSISETYLMAVSAEDGGPVADGSVRIEAALPNWLRHVMFDAGSAQGAAAELPAQLEVPVRIDAATRRIVALDVDATATQLADYREIGIREWKHTDAPLAGMRQAAKIPGAIAREAPGLFRGLRKALRGAREDLRERERPHQAQRDAGANVRAQLEANPAQRIQMRSSVLEHGTTMARTVAAGAADADGFEAWLAFNESATILTPDEAASMRRIAGLG
jgi:hypothetical protein